MSGSRSVKRSLAVTGTMSLTPRTAMVEKARERLLSLTPHEYRDMLLAMDHAAQAEQEEQDDLDELLEQFRVEEDEVRQFLVGEDEDDDGD